MLGLPKRDLEWSGLDMSAMQMCTYSLPTVDSAGKSNLSQYSCKPPCHSIIHDADDPEEASISISETFSREEVFCSTSLYLLSSSLFEAAGVGAFEPVAPMV